MSTQFVTIREVWASIPPMDCTGACADHCTAIAMTEAELKLMRERIPSFPSGKESLDAMYEANDRGEHYRCPALLLGRCAVYSVRPTVCRLFGNAESLPCPHGCQRPQLSRAEASEIMDRAREAGGEVVL